MDTLRFILYVVAFFALRVHCFTEKRLIKQILDNYQQVGLQGLPVINSSDLVDVGFGIGLTNILKVDEPANTITIKSWTRYTWNDPLLKWDPKDWDGLRSVKVSAKDIWKPDISLYNGIDTKFCDSPEPLASVLYDGSLIWIPSVTYTGFCNTSHVNEYSCSFKFGSWVYDGDTLDMHFYEDLEGLDLTNYMGNNEWEIVHSKAEKNVAYYPCCEDTPFPDLLFSLSIKRIDKPNSSRWIYYY